MRKYCEAFDRGDFETALEALDEGIDYDLTHFPDGRVITAPPAWSRHGRGKGSGLELERPTFRVWTVRDGKAVHIEFYATRAEALAAVGLRA